MGKKFVRDNINSFGIEKKIVEICKTLLELVKMLLNFVK